MNIRHLLSNIVCGFIPGKSRRDLVRTRIRYNTRPFIQFVRDYFSGQDIKIKTCVGGGCRNMIVLVDSRYAFKFPLRNNGYERAMREFRITTALRKYTKTRIPEMEIIQWRGLYVRKYEFFPGVVLDEIPASIVALHRHHIARQIAKFIYEIGIADPIEIRDMKPNPDEAPGFMRGWFHNDIGANFIINPETFDIVGFIDWEVAKFTTFDLGLYIADHHWDKMGFRGMIVDVMREYSHLFYSGKK